MQKSAEEGGAGRFNAEKQKLVEPTQSEIAGNAEVPPTLLSHGFYIDSFDIELSLMGLFGLDGVE